MARRAPIALAGLLFAGVLATQPVVRGAGERSAQAGATSARATVTVRNPLAEARPSETIELAASALVSTLGVADLQRIHVVDDRTRKDLLTQAIDDGDDGTFDILIFQTDLAAGETRTFTLTTGERRVPTPADFRAYGRLVHERRDDFAWENDRTAHRVYGAALETFSRDPLTSSGIDVWAKRTRRMVINDWYMVDDYHRDAGEGADFYSVGASRGCGGSGFWNAGSLSVPANFRDARTLANGPIRVMFELTYPVWSVAGVSTSTRISLDAGHSLNRIETRLVGAPSSSAGAPAIGIKQAAGADYAVRREQGVARSWEPLAAGHGHLGCGVVVPPDRISELRRAGSDNLLVLRDGAASFAYWAGAGWDQSGDFTGLAAWDAYLDAAARRHLTPVVTSLK